MSHYEIEVDLRHIAHDAGEFMQMNLCKINWVSLKCGNMIAHGIIISEEEQHFIGYLKILHSHLSC